MAVPNIAQVSAKLFDLLKHLEPTERQRVVAATMMLFGEAAPSPGTIAGATPNRAAGSAQATGGGGQTPKSFLDAKDPQNKSEALAVAARFRELVENSESHTKDQLREVFAAARRNFDSSNYSKDIRNARNQSGYFNKSTAKGSETLSYYGQNYVDALPDREAAKDIARPKVRPKSKGASKKKAAAKKS
jgi:hypothetical protein